MTPDPDWFNLESAMDTVVRKACKAAGRLHYHTKDSKRSEAGFPDWVVVLEDMTVFAELKRGVKEKMTEEQTKWITSMATQSPSRNIFVIKGREMLDMFVDMILFGHEKNAVTWELYHKSMYHIEKDYRHWVKKLGDEMRSPEFETAFKKNMSRKNRTVLI